MASSSSPLTTRTRPSVSLFTRHPAPPDPPLFLGFPHGLEFIIGPGLFAPAGMLAGLGVVAAVRRIRA